MSRVKIVIKNKDKRQGWCAPRLLVVVFYYKEILEKSWIIAYNLTMSSNPYSAFFLINNGHIAVKKTPWLLINGPRTDLRQEPGGAWKLFGRVLIDIGKKETAAINKRERS